MRTTTSTLIPAQRSTSTDVLPPTRLVDPAVLVCPGCGEQVRCAPPGYWRVADGLPVSQFSHHDASALCRTRSGAVAEPIEAV